MDDYKRYLLIFIALFVGVLIAPLILAYLGFFMSKYITMVGFLALLFGVTVFLAYKNRRR